MMGEHVRRRKKAELQFLETGIQTSPPSFLNQLSETILKTKF
jgi:hypothetical protein